jgi:tryptophan-rich sensory protein
VCLGICFAVAAAGGAITQPKIADWYAGLAKPAWTPPAWLFGPVWSFLYGAMGVAAWLIWRRTGIRGAILPLTLFAAQLALNLSWSCLFFGLQNPGLAFLDILVLWTLILLTTIAFWRRSTPAGILMTPYLAWVAFAACLNFAIWRLNG